MRIIQIQDGISVNIDMIEAVEAKDDNTCKVYIGSRSFKVTYPYATFISMLNAKEEISKEKTPQERADATQEKLLKQFWAG